MPVINLVIDKKWEEKINEWISKGYFEDRAQVILRALELLERYIEEYEKEMGKRK